MEKHPLSHLKELMAANPSMNWENCAVEMKVYTRPNATSDEDPTNTFAYYERKTVRVPVQTAAGFQSIQELMDYLGARYYEDVAMGNRVVETISSRPATEEEDGDLNVILKDVGPRMVNHIKEVRHYYFPQLDCVMKTLLPGALYSLEDNGHNLDIYSSGRSYHAYGASILTFEEWAKWLGEMLLINTPGENNIVDVRWIGHSLKRSQSFLRLTANSSGYLMVPEYQGEASELRKQDF